MHKIFNFPTIKVGSISAICRVRSLSAGSFSRTAAGNRAYNKSPVHDLFDYKLPIHSYEFRNALGKKMKKKLKQTKRGYRTQYKL